MKRKDFLKGASLAGFSLAIPGGLSATAPSAPAGSSSCTLIPTETAGPFPLDLTENTTFFRQDIRETETGVPFTVRLKIIGTDNCEPMQNVRVNIWHCSKDGLYSGYSSNMNPAPAGSTFLRGYQFTDANGEVEFLTIFPGWYNGRIAHIHFQVYVSSSYSAISQLTFDIAQKNAIYLANPTLYTKGADPLTFSSDNIFSDGVEFQLATLSEDATTGGYTSYLEVSVQGSGVTGLGHIEKETAKVMEVGQNFPNPYQYQTTIPITLKQAAHLKVELWDLSGKKVAMVFDEKRAAGVHEISVVPNQLELPVGNYVYQVEAITDKGDIFRLPKMMTFR